MNLISARFGVRVNGAGVGPVMLIVVALPQPELVELVAEAETENEAVVAQSTVVHALWSESFEALIGRVVGCFLRRETRLTCRNLVEGCRW